MLEKLKNLSRENLDRMLALEEAVSMSAYARNLEEEYGNLDITVPDWLIQANETLRDEIANRVRATQMAEMRRLENELEGLKTQTERKTEAQKKLADIQKKLGLVATSKR